MKLTDFINNKNSKVHETIVNMLHFYFGVILCTLKSITSSE